MKNRHGFTLIEILITVTIIMVLMGIAYPVYQSYKRSAEVQNTRQLLAKVEMAINQYNTYYEEYPFYNGTWSSGDWDDVKRNNKQLYKALDDEGLLKDLIDEKKRVVTDGGDKMFVDFWDKPMIYIHLLPSGDRPDAMPAAPVGSGRMFELWSAGPDGEFEMLGRTKTAGGAAVAASQLDDDNITATKMF